jgi:hypothetical protein
MERFVVLFGGAMDSFEAGRVEEGAVRCRTLMQNLKVEGYKDYSKVVGNVIKSAKNGASQDYLFSKIQELFFSFAKEHSGN